MAGEIDKFPLPPREENKGRRKKTDPLHKRSLRAAGRGVKAVVDAPVNLMDRINKELYKRNAELAVRNKTLALLRNLDQISLGTSSIGDMAKKMCTAIATDLGYDIVSIAIVDQEKKQLSWLAVSSSVLWIETALNKILIDDIRMPLNEHINSLTILKQSKEEFVDDLHQVFPPALVDELTKDSSAKGSEPIQHSILYPLQFSEQTLGLLTLSSSRTLRQVSSYEKEAVSGIIGLVALALYKSKIYEDLQRTSMALADANQQLQALDKVKSEFLSIASHQLYTPLTALRGYISMLVEGDFGELSEQQKPIMDILSTSAERLIRLIRDLLDISRIESGRFELNLQPVDMVKMTDELMQSLYPNAVVKGLTLSFQDPPKGLPKVIGDEQRLRQVMLNFIDNAIKYTTKGWVKVSVSQDKDNVVFSVSDSGKGITAEEIPRLFHKFSRVGGASRFHTEGTGLGLYVAKQVVQEHKGDVLIESPGVGKGSTFSMRLPAENSPRSLKVGQKATVIIKAADAKGENDQILANLTIESEPKKE